MDPRLQRIIAAANASTGEEEQEAFHPRQPPYSRAATTESSSALSFSQHFNNAGSLQERFAYRGPAPTQQPRAVFHEHFQTDESYGPTRQRATQQPFNSNPGQRAPRISLTPQSLHLNENPSNAHSNGIARPDSYHQSLSRASTLANLRTQPVLTRNSLQSSLFNNVTPQKGPSDGLYGQMARATPHTSISEEIYTPPQQRSSTPDQGPSSPTIRVAAHRIGRFIQPMKDSQNRRISSPTTSNRAPAAFAGELEGALTTRPDHTNTPPMVNGIQLVSTHDLPDRFRPIFKFALFNAIQSKIFPAVYKTDDNIVVSAPTGGGKTAILELAIVKLMATHTSGQFKIVYQAPTKSLCSERARDWTAKFGVLNISTAELTGDTSAAELQKISSATIIVTTPEKWDSITRKWKDYIKLLQLVKLFLIDEVHILKDARGATLEAVVSRMKSIGTNVRFVALSATVPNSHDIALWLGKDHTNQHLPAHRETFGEEFRPVKLQKHVHGYEESGNDFAFDKNLSSKLPSLIAKYTHKKPIMVFCFTRKSCENTAEILAQWWAGLGLRDRAWPAPTERVPVSTKELQSLVSRGVAYHHAGLDPGDRMVIERGYLKGQINVICCTSTLAVGVNLPCHLVILKGTVGFQEGRPEEFSDLEVMQMLGRAGRPQFDDSAVAVIMTTKKNVDRYTKLVTGGEILESTLHLNLIEHLNSEVGLGTVKDLYSAKTWLSGTFLSVRMKQNPRYYKFDCDTGSRDADERLQLVCERDIKLLQETELITKDTRFTCTKYGEAMSKYMVKFQTMRLLLTVPEHARMSQILDIVSQASEFKDVKMKATDRAHFRELNKSPMIKWPIKDAVTTTAHKVSLIVQVQLGGVDLPNEKDFNRRQYLTDQSLVFDRIQRLVRCVVDCKTFDNDAVATQNALELSRSIAAQYWEHLPTQLRQIPNIGAAAVRKLSAAGLTTIDKLLRSDSAAIERAMSRNPPFGHTVLEALKDFPRLTLKADVVWRTTKAGKLPEVKVRASLGLLKKTSPYWRRELITLTFMAGVSNGHLAHIWKGSIRKLEKGCEIYFTAELLNFSDAVSCFIACDDIVGTVTSVILAHNLPESVFPKLPPTVLRSPAKVVQSVEGDESDYDEGFNWDEAVGPDIPVVGEDPKKATDVKKPAYKAPEDVQLLDNDGFLDIDAIAPVPSKPVEAQPQPEPQQMANGKWMCNHVCRGGKKLKNGITCKHKCCHEGLEKPRKVSVSKKAKVQEVTNDGKVVKINDQTPLPWPARSPAAVGSLSQKDIAGIASLGKIEVLDLSQALSPVPYENIAPRDYRKLNTLHNQTGTGKPVSTLRNVKPTASYNGSSHPFASYMQGSMQPTAPMFSSAGKATFSPHTTLTDSGVAMDELGGSDTNISPSRPDKSIQNAIRDDQRDADPYPGFMADLNDEDHSYSAFANSDDKEPSSEFGIQAAHEAASSDEMLKTDILGVGNSCFKSFLDEPTKLGAGNTPKRKLEDDDGSEDAHHNKIVKTKSHQFGDSREGLSKEDEEAALTMMQLSDQPSPQVKQRPDWLDEFDPDFVAMFDYVEFAE